MLLVEDSEVDDLLISRGLGGLGPVDGGAGTARAVLGDDELSAGGDVGVACGEVSRNSQGLDVSLEGGRVVEAGVGGKEVGKKTADVGSGHARAAGDSVGSVAVVVRRVGGNTRGVEVNRRTGVREVRNFVEDVRGANGNDVADVASERSGSVVRGIVAVVSSGNCNVHTSVGQGNKSALNCRGAAVETKRQGCDRTNEVALTRTRFMLGSDVVDTADQARGSSTTGGVEDFDTNKVGVASNTNSVTRGGSRNVSAYSKVNTADDRFAGRRFTHHGRYHQFET